MKFIKGVLKWGGIGFCCLLLIGMFAGNQNSSNTSTPSSITTASVATSPSQPKANPMKMSIAAIENGVEENEINIQNRIKQAGGVLVSGRVQSVEAMWGKPVVHFRGKNEYLNVSAFLGSGDKDRAANLRKGETVTLLCQTAKKVVSAALYDCRFN